MVAIDAYSNLGNVYKDMGRHSDAMDCYLKAIDIRPVFPEACSNLAALYKDQGHIAKAMEWYSKALSMKHDLGRYD